MSVVINTNVDSLKIQGMLNSSTNKLSTSMQRMSSGLKILSAKDDAAGTVISARMQVQLNGNEIAQKNVQNGNAMLSTAESNIDTVLDNVSRIRDLTLQAKNGTYSEEEISAMQDEVEERMAEIDRVSKSSKYSQLNLFGDSSMTDGVSFQVGANATDNDVIEANGDIFKSVEFAEITGRKDKVKNEEDAVDFDALATAEFAAATGGESYVEISRSEYMKIINGEDPAAKAKVQHIKFFKEEDATAEDNTVIADKYYKKVADTEITAQGLTKATLPTFNNSDEADGKYKSYATIAQDKEPALALELDILDDKGFTQAVNDLDKAIDDLTGRKSLIGSAQNRLDSALDVLSTQFQNLSSAKSIITDADIASEASNFTQQQILQQVSTSLLAQANQAPSIALSLI